MRASLEFLLGLLDRDEPAHVAQDDFEGVHGPAIRMWQQMGFVSQHPGMNPAPSCPHCYEGVPYRLGARHICSRCHSKVDPRHLLLWRLDRKAFLHWLADQIGLRGGVRQLDERLWQLGNWESRGMRYECFYRRSGLLSDVEKTRLVAFRNALVFSAPSCPAEPDIFNGPSVSLLELLRLEESLSMSGLELLIKKRGNVRFDTHSGGLWVGDAWLGEIPVGSKEFHFLDYLARHLDHFVAYSDLKHHVLRQSGSIDATEEATFCQNLKSRIKKKWIPKIDLLLTTTNKADGYRLRAYTEPSLGGKAR